MKRLKQAVARLTAPLRRQIHARIDAKLEAAGFAASDRAGRANQAMGQDAALAAARHALAAYEPPTPWLGEVHRVLDEVGQMLDAVIAEQFRLQSQVEDLHRHLVEATA